MQAAVDRMRPSRQSDDEIAQLLRDARFKPDAASAQEAAFFAKHGCAMPCHAMPCHAMPCHAMPCTIIGAV